jgi:acetoacetyl-CoA synthetase
MEPQLLWTPSDTLKKNCNLTHYMQWLAQHKNLHFESYDALWRWSVTDIEAFWESIWQYFDINASQPYSRVLGNRAMPAAQWFPDARLNYAEHIFRAANDAHPAALFLSETTGLLRADGSLNVIELSWGELHTQVAALAAWLRSHGVKSGDRVVAYAPNMPETLVAFLAAASIGAVWSSCSPDIGAAAVLDRFRQIEPRVLFAIDGYIYNGKPNDRREVVRELVAALPSLEHVVHIPYLNRAEPDLTDARETTWSAIQKQPHAPIVFEQVAFDHPLWVLYSSGTTGLPKPIVHSQGGILIEHLKAVSLHMDLSAGDRFFWFTTTGWMMWNFLIGGLLVGATALMYDGSPGAMDMDVLWRFAEQADATCFGTSAAYITACIKAGLQPRVQHPQLKLKCIGSTGSPLSIDGFEWVYDQVGHDTWLASISGGTDVCTAFVGGCPLLPVYMGEIQCRMLGAAVEAFDDSGKPLRDEVGEFAVTQPMPSMPIYFWNDAGNKRYRESYFEMYPGIWRHGDWVKITPRDSLVIYGRSDSTINRQGVRIGTSEIYRAVEAVPEVLDSLIIDLEMLNRPSYMPLFVVLREGATLDVALKTKIKNAIKSALSARQVPDDVFAIPEVPRTLNGKKMEVPIKKILLGQPAEKAVTPGSMANPSALAYFVDMAKRL